MVIPRVLWNSLGLVSSQPFDPCGLTPRVVSEWFRAAASFNSEAAAPSVLDLSLATIHTRELQSTSSNEELTLAFLFQLIKGNLHFCFLESLQTYIGMLRCFLIFHWPPPSIDSWTLC